MATWITAPEMVCPGLSASTPAEWSSRRPRQGARGNDHCVTPLGSVAPPVAHRLVRIPCPTAGIDLHADIAEPCLITRKDRTTSLWGAAGTARQ